MSAVLLPLNDTVVMFLHPEDTRLSRPRVVQVTINTQRKDGAHVAQKAFIVAQQDISDIITKIVTTHLRAPLPPFFVLEDDCYKLVARHRPWPFGRDRLNFSWGDETVRPCDDKWSFVFIPYGGGEQ